jgi:signal transduction histidine kinase
MSLETLSVGMPTREAIFQTYDKQRRLRFTSIVATFQLVAALVGFLFEIVNVFLPGNAGLLTTTQSLAIFGAVIFLSVMYSSALIAVRLKQATLAAGLTLGTTMITVFSIQYIWIIAAGGHLDPQGWALCMGFLVPISIAGATAPRWLLYLAIIIDNLYSVWLLLHVFLLNGLDTSPRHELVGIIGGTLLIEWTVALAFFGIQNGYRRIVDDMGRLQYEVEQARQMDALKDQFIASVNHELRNPIMALIGNLDLLRRTVEKGDTSMAGKALGRTSQAALHLRELVESILSIQQIEAADRAQVNWQAVDLRAALEVAANSIDPRESQLGERELKLQIPPGFAIWGDRVMLEQILTNLISNAIKYSPPATPLEVRAWLERGRTPRARIAVQDHGLGIPPEQAPLLFQRFVRLPRDLASKVSGNGLGLYLCRVYTERLNGTIWVESSGVPGQGSTFQMEFVPAPATVPPTPTTPAGIAARS